MIVAAALDASADADNLRTQLASLNLPEVTIHIEKIQKNHLAATSFHPQLTAPAHEHRHLPDILAIIQAAQLSDTVKTQAAEIFQNLARAEAKVHNIAPEQVHFHEVGAADAIVDIVGACVALESLAVEKIYCSALTVGTGTVKCAHGTLPVPAPATAELIKGIEIRPSNIPFELLTPTGAAILTTLADSFGPPPPMKIESIGYGAGQRDLPETPNLLRLFIGQTTSQSDTDTALEDSTHPDLVTILETNLDDATGQLIGYITEQLLNAGALDAFCTPVTMKKNRPGTQITVICNPPDSEKLQHLLLLESTTFGVRHYNCRRTTLAREHQTVETPFGPIRIKIGSLKGRPITANPEFADCQKAAQAHHVPLKSVITAAITAYQKP